MDALRFGLTTANLCEGVFVVTLAGEADLSSAHELRQEFDEVIGDGGTYVIVDLLEVPFVDSTILGVLLRYAGRLRMAGGDLVLVCNDFRVLRAFEITGLAAHFTFERSLAPAVDAALARVFA